jgi:uncharacterized protein (TIGR02246 family)
MLSAADNRAIEDLVRRADDAATRRDDASYAALYTEDGIMEGSEGRAEGPAAIRDAVGAVWAREPTGSKHIARDVVIAEEAGSVIDPLQARHRRARSNNTFRASLSDANHSAYPRGLAHRPAGNNRGGA